MQCEENLSVNGNVTSNVQGESSITGKTKWTTLQMNSLMGTNPLKFQIPEADNNFGNLVCIFIQKKAYIMSSL